MDIYKVTLHLDLTHPWAILGTVQSKVLGYLYPENASGGTAFRYPFLDWGFWEKGLNKFLETGDDRGNAYSYTYEAAPLQSLLTHSDSRIRESAKCLLKEIESSRT